jgi:hypothetical protein
MPSSPDRLREFLERHGASPKVVAGGLEVLLRGWEQTVAAVEAGYALTFDDYLSDVDGRQLLAQALEVASAEQAARITDRLTALDERMRAAVEPVRRCVWGHIVEEEEGWSPERNWWYYARPRRGTPAFLEEFGRD